MTYYHIVVETKEKKNGKYLKIIEYDRTDLDEIKQDIIRPYLSDEKFLLDGAFLTISEISSLKVKKTNGTSAEILSKANNDIPAGVITFITTENVISGNEYTEDITRKLIKENGEINKETIENPKKSFKNNKIFIVHGHDNSIKNEMARFIEKLDLDPIILHEQPNASKTIIEKIESNNDVGYAVVLYTPCDVGSRKDMGSELKPRARQNVVFEHGYFIGHLGRNRVAALLSDGVEAPNDISGVVYIHLDERGAWKLDLARELKEAGFQINTNAIL